MQKDRTALPPVTRPIPLSRAVSAETSQANEALRRARGEQLPATEPVSANLLTRALTQYADATAGLFGPNIGELTFTTPDGTTTRVQLGAYTARQFARLVHAATTDATAYALFTSAADETELAAAPTARPAVAVRRPLALVAGGAR